MILLGELQSGVQAGICRTGIAQRIESRSSICWKGLSVACVWQSRGGCVSLLGVFAAETGRVEWEQSSQFKSVWKSSVSLPVSAGHRRLSLWIESFCQTFVCKPFLHIYGEENPEKSMTTRLPPNPPHHERCAKTFSSLKTYISLAKTNGEVKLLTRLTLLHSHCTDL